MSTRNHFCMVDESSVVAVKKPLLYTKVGLKVVATLL
jgi:hypothetical protein